MINRIKRHVAAGPCRWAFLFVFIVCVIGGKPQRDVSWLTEHPTIQRLHQLQNAHRSRHGLKPLRLNSEMCVVAQRHAVWMASSGAFQHSAAGYAENIHWGVNQPEQAIDGWVRSSGHHANIVGGYQECGFGYMAGRNGTRWVTVFR